MRDNAESNGIVNPSLTAPIDLLWGAGQIGQVIGRTSRAAYHILERGEIKSAKKIAGRWCVSRSALLRELGVA
jgi:hypothetical protein